MVKKKKKKKKADEFNKARCRTNNPNLKKTGCRTDKRDVNQTGGGQIDQGDTNRKGNSTS